MRLAGPGDHLAPGPFRALLAAGEGEGQQAADGPLALRHFGALAALAPPSGCFGGGLGLGGRGYDYSEGPPKDQPRKAQYLSACSRWYAMESDSSGRGRVENLV